jgi:hypothetical protein
MDETQFKVACLYHEICGATKTFYSVEEYDIYGDDWICAECYDSMDMWLIELQENGDDGTGFRDYL